MPVPDVTATTEATSARIALALESTTGRPTASLRHGGRVVLEAQLGVIVDGLDLGSNAIVIDRWTREIREEYRAHTGKSTGVRSVLHDETTVRLRTGSIEWDIIARVSADGVAIRYRLPTDATTLNADGTRLRAPAGSRAWVLDYQTWYETPRYGCDLAVLPAGDYGLPTLLGVGDDCYLLISESDIDARSSGAHLVHDGDSLLFATADADLDVQPGHLTPWRVIIAGHLHTVVESTLVDDLAPPADAEAFLPRPGRAAWSWWSSQYSGADLAVQKRFCDYAASQGWEHLLVDCGWDAAWVPELVSYASRHGIQVHLWSAWSDLDGPEALRQLELWRSWGVAGIKVDFMESESRERYRWYEAIIAETARVGLMVNFHGSVIPRGWSRTHPHVVSYEGIRGAEWYVFYGEPLSAAHNVIQPFTRNVVGSMDYTPVTFSAPRRQTTDAHELALAVVFESGITHFADDPASYLSRPLAHRFLGEVPSAWDESRLLDGNPDSHAVMGRRRGDRWFIGCISSSDEAMTVDLSVADLLATGAEAWIITDSPEGLISETRAADRTTLAVTVPPRGGMVAIIHPAGTEALRASSRAPLDIPAIDRPLLVAVDDEIEIRTRAARLRPAPGWQVERVDDRRFRARSKTARAPGDLAVFTAEDDGHDGVPVTAPVRILAPLVGGPIDVAALPFLSARNEIGPVERNRANGGGDPGDGAPLTVVGTHYDSGLGVSTDSAVQFAITGDRTTLTGSVAIDDETLRATARATIEVDGVVAREFHLAGSLPPVNFEVDVTGGNVLTLRTARADGDEAHIDWLHVRLIP